MTSLNTFLIQLSFFFSVKCEDRNCQLNALCKDNRCVCADGYITNGGVCEGMNY